MNFMSMVPLQSVILKFHENKDLLIKELRKKLYPTSAYYLSTAIPTIPINLIDFGLMMIPLYFIADLNFYSWTHLLVFCAINIVGWWISEAWGILLSIIGGTAETTIQIAPAIFVPF